MTIYIIGSLETICNIRWNIFPVKNMIKTLVISAEPREIRRFGAFRTMNRTWCFLPVYEQIQQGRIQREELIGGMMMNLLEKKKELLCALGLPLAVGGVSALISMDGMRTFEHLNKPSFTPPGWMFPVAWTALYLAMGYASYLVWRSDRPKTEIHKALKWYGAQLAANFLWSPLFFALGLYLPAFLWLLVLLVLITVTMWRFFRIRPAAGWLLTPYLCWTVFAGCLNAAMWMMHRA
ncbi:MAG: tryptophan-rich sensory protein [Clostridiales bacterium]|nr:tryptophan-rich sensory protein [Clostridiales bacterium]